MKTERLSTLEDKYVEEVSEEQVKDRKKFLKAEVKKMNLEIKEIEKLEAEVKVVKDAKAAEVAASQIDPMDPNALEELVPQP